MPTSALPRPHPPQFLTGIDWSSYAQGQRGGSSGLRREHPRRKEEADWTDGLEEWVTRGDVAMITGLFPLSSNWKAWAPWERLFKSVFIFPKAPLVRALLLSGLFPSLASLGSERFTSHIVYANKRIPSTKQRVRQKKPTRAQFTHRLGAPAE